MLIELLVRKLQLGVEAIIKVLMKLMREHYIAFDCSQFKQLSVSLKLRLLKLEFI